MCRLAPASRLPFEETERKEDLSTTPPGQTCVQNGNGFSTKEITQASNTSTTSNTAASPVITSRQRAHQLAERSGAPISQTVWQRPRHIINAIWQSGHTRRESAIQTFLHKRNRGCRCAPRLQAPDLRNRKLNINERAGSIG